MRLLPQTMLPHQGEVPDKSVQNEFRTMRAKRSWGRSTGQRLPPRSEAISHDRSHRRATYQGGSATVGRGVACERAQWAKQRTGYGVGAGESRREQRARRPLRQEDHDPAEKMAQGVCRAPVPHPPTLAGVFKKKRRRQSGFRFLRSPKVSKGGACRQAENRSMNTGSEGTPKSPKAFWGGGAATKRLSVLRKAKHRKSGVCRDEPRDFY